MSPIVNSVALIAISWLWQTLLMSDVTHAATHKFHKPGGCYKIEYFKYKKSEGHKAFAISRFYERGNRWSQACGWSYGFATEKEAIERALAGWYRELRGLLLALWKQQPALRSSASVSRKLLQHDLLDAVSVLGIVQMFKDQASDGETAGLDRPRDGELASLTLKLRPNGIEHPLEISEALWTASVGLFLGHYAKIT